MVDHQEQTSSPQEDHTYYTQYDPPSANDGGNNTTNINKRNQVKKATGVPPALKKGNAKAKLFWCPFSCRTFLLFLLIPVVVVVVASAVEFFAMRARTQWLRPSTIIYAVEDISAEIFHAVGYYSVRIFDLLYLVDHLRELVWNAWLWIYKWIAWLFPLGEIGAAVSAVVMSILTLATSPLMTFKGWVDAFRESTGPAINFWLWIVGSALLLGAVFRLSRKYGVLGKIRAGVIALYNLVTKQ